jgi:hypothetical protein
VKAPEPRQRWSSALLAILGLSLGSACSALKPPPPLANSWTSSKVQVEQGDYRGVAWASNGYVYVGRGVDLGSRDSEKSRSRLFRFRPDGSGLERVPLPETQGDCNVVEYESPSLLPDGRIQYFVFCPDRLPGPDTDDMRYEALDLRDGTVERIVDAPKEVAYNVRLSWSHDFTTGAIDKGQDCGSISLITRDGRLRRPGITVDDSGHSFPIDSMFRGGSYDDHHGCAAQPAWSPTKSEIAFFAGWVDAKIDSRVVRGRSLFVAAPDSNPRKLLSVGRRQPFGPWWSPDGGSVAYSTEDGTFIVDAASGRQERIAEAYLETLSWSPDGKAIIGTESLFSVDTPFRSQIVLLERK